MKKIFTLIGLSILLMFSSCSTEEDVAPASHEEGKYISLAKSDASGKGGGNNGNGNENGQEQAGLITAGEWSDLSNWNYWNNLQNEKEFSKMFSYWSFFTKKRLSVLVENTGVPVINAKVELIRNKKVIYTTKTDNKGLAELWVGLFQKETIKDLNDFSIRVNNKLKNQKLVLFKDGINKIEVTSNNENLKRVELSFIVDATGSMGDELEFLKEDLKSVINKVKKDNSVIDIYTSTVFYRDEGDEYVTKKSEFTNDLDNTIDFINKQKADGGGDFPEAVHTALDVAINELQWSEKARTRIAFLLLDAPPHYEANIVKIFILLLKKQLLKELK